MRGPVYRGRVAKTLRAPVAVGVLLILLQQHAQILYPPRLNTESAVYLNPESHRFREIQATFLTDLCCTVN